MIRKRKYRLRTLWRAMTATFHPRNLRRALHSVTHGAREYLCFYLAMIVIGTGFATVALTSDAELSHTRQQVTDNYDYHIEIGGLTEDQMAAANNRFLYELSREAPWLGRVRSQQETDGSYTFFVTAPDGYAPSDTLAYVRAEVLRVVSGECIVSTSPLYEYDAVYRSPLLRERWMLTVAWALVSMLILVVLFRIRLEHFRFTYGIYSTCGADFPMLYGTAAGDMLVLMLLSLPLSAALGVGVTALLCLPRGIGLHLSVQTVPSLLPLWVLVILLSVRGQIRMLSRRTPLWMLTGQDTAGLVSSPRRSLRLFGASFPGRYEMATFWRLRRYYARLILSAVVFASLFVSGLYMAEVEDYRTGVPAYEYVITYDETDGAETETGADGGAILPNVDKETAEEIRTDADLFIPSVQALPTVSYVWWQAETDAALCMSHLLIRPEQIGGTAGSYAVLSEERASDGYTFAMQNYAYVAIDQMWLDTVIGAELGEIEGDPTAVLTDPYSVIVTEDIYNQAAYSFSPGDKIVVATLTKIDSPLQLVADARDALRQQLSNCSFSYQEYTVCAVVRGMRSEDTITFGVNYDAFAALTGKPAVRDRLYVYVENGTSFEDVRAAESAIRHEVSYFFGWSVSRTGNYFRSTVQNGRGTSDVIRLLAVLALLISPAVWLFSQIMFYRKRRQEFMLLRTLGAGRGRVSALFLLAGGVLSCLAFLATAALVCVATYLVYLILAILLPALHLTDAFPYAFHLSIPAVLLCVGISLLCGFLSCLVPGWLLRRGEARQGNDTL